MEYEPETLQEIKESNALANGENRTNKKWKDKIKALIKIHETCRYKMKADTCCLTEKDNKPCEGKDIDCDWFEIENEELVEVLQSLLEEGE